MLKIKTEKLYEVLKKQKCINTLKRNWKKIYLEKKFSKKNLMNWNISVIEGKEINKDSISSGERKWRRPFFF